MLEVPQGPPMRWTLRFAHEGAAGSSPRVGPGRSGRSSPGRWPGNGRPGSTGRRPRGARLRQGSGSAGGSPTARCPARWAGRPRGRWVGGPVVLAFPGGGDHDARERGVDEDVLEAPSDRGKEPAQGQGGQRRGAEREGEEDGKSRPAPRSPFVTAFLAYARPRSPQRHAVAWTAVPRSRLTSNRRPDPRQPWPSLLSSRAV